MNSNSNLKHQVVHSLKWVAIGKIATQLIKWMMTFWVIRLLAPEDYGVVVMADVIFGFLTLLTGALFAPSIIQAKELSQKMLQQIFGMTLIVHTAIFTLQMLFADSIGAFYQSENVASILKVNAWCFLILAFQVIPSAILTRNMEFKKVSVISAISNIAAAVTTFVLAFSGYGFWSIIVGEIVLISLSTLMILFVQPLNFMPEFKLSEVKKYLRFGSLLTLHSIIFYIFLGMDVTIAGRMMSATEVGFFAVGLQFALMPQKKILPLLKQVAFPAFSKIQHQPERIINYIIKAQKLSFLITIPIFWGLASVVDIVIPIVIGDKWSEAILPTTLILIIMPLRFSEELFGPALKSQKKAKHLLGNVSVLLVILTIAILLFVDLGAVGLALAWLTGFPIAYFIVVIRNCKTFNINLGSFLQILFRPIFSGVLMLICIFAIKQWNNSVELLTLFIQIIVGATVFGLSTWLIDKNSLKEVRALMKKKATNE